MRTLSFSFSGLARSNARSPGPGQRDTIASPRFHFYDLGHYDEEEDRHAIRLSLCYDDRERLLRLQSSRSQESKNVFPLSFSEDFFVN